MVAHRALGDIGADLRHDTGDFVTEDAWDGESKAVLRQMQVRAAQPGGLNVDHHLSADRIRDTEIFNIEHPVEPIEHCSLHSGFLYGRRFHETLAIKPGGE